MRRLLVLLMVLLLPLRGWAGDVMALDVAKSQAAGQATEEQSAMPADCPMLAAAASAPTSGDDAAPGSMLSCNCCDLCVPLTALAVAEVGAAPLGRHVMRPAPDVVALDSAPLASLKPPIS